VKVSERAAATERKGNSGTWGKRNEFDHRGGERMEREEKKVDKLHLGG
jgi:hypothetical protein